MMICGRCGNMMVQGDFSMQKEGIGRKGGAFIYPVAVFYKDNEMICEAEGETTIGYYCPECGLLVGVFPLTHPTGFVGKYRQDLDDNVDKLPTKNCPECGSDIDVDYPRCPFCGYQF